jgi:CheY-like chemotaxis protein
VQVQADRRRLKQVLLNLLGNAIKYNRPGGTVGVRSRVEEGWLWLGVEDTGPGLTPEQQARLFQPFERLGAAQSGVEGTGIGLALSRRLVDAMGGRIGVSSVPGEGSTFWLRLPLAGAPAALPVLPDAGAGQGGAEAATAQPPQTVLYIEDNPVNVVLMEAMMARMPGVQLHCAATPTEGLALAARHPPALVLLDIHLPEMDGFAVLRRLREMPATAHTPVVAVSANALQDDINAAGDAGFAAYLTKPLSLQSLLDAVKLHLGRP